MEEEGLLLAQREAVAAALLPSFGEAMMVGNAWICRLAAVYVDVLFRDPLAFPSTSKPPPINIRSLKN